MKNKPINASAPGKIHFIGEHTAVYFKPAILAAIDKRCFVELTPTDSPEIVITSKNFDKTVKLTIDEILQIRDMAQKGWETYRERNDITLLKTIVPDEITYPIIAIGETLRHFNTIPNSGFRLVLDSQIPIGSGHGSSAAVAVSVVGAVAQFLNESTEKDTIGKIAIKVEQKKHGNPSYGDVAAVVNGGLIWFQKKTPEDIVVKPLDFTVPETISRNLLVIQSGVPVESTGEMVHHASEIKKENPKEFEKALEKQEKLTHDLLEAIKKADEVGLVNIIKAGEKNLETMGVVSSFAKTLIREIETAGGAAKICGAGGISEGSGVVLAYHKERRTLEKIAKNRGLAYYTVLLGGEGLILHE